MRIGEGREAWLTTSDGTKVFRREYGPGDGPVVVLCHGLGAGGIQFDADARAFADAGYRVLVPDLRGHGASGRPDPGMAETYSIARMAQDLIEMFDAAGADRVHYVGNSLGGILALFLLGDHGRRFRTLATFGTALALDLPDFTSALIPLSYRLAGKRLAGKAAAWATTTNRAARPMIETLIGSLDPAVGAAIARAVSRYDFTANALGFAGPYLLMRGDADRQVNAALKASLPALAALDTFVLSEMAGAGHCANLDRPEAFRAVLLDFWRRHDDRSRAPAPVSGPAAAGAGGSKGRG